MVQVEGNPAAILEIEGSAEERARGTRAKKMYRVAGEAGSDGPPGRKDHFAEQDGVTFAGTHMLLDLWGAGRLDDVEYLERTLRRAVRVSGATLLHLHLHRFGDGGGVTGVAVLAESHITVHTWPERSFAAFDVFMCGDSRPDLAVEVIREALGPARTVISTERRGVVA